MSASPKAVCVPCRRVYKGEGRRHATDASASGRGWFPKRWMGNGAGMHDAPQNCPVCHEPTITVPWTWRPPRRSNLRAWKRIARGDFMTEKLVTDS